MGNIYDDEFIGIAHVRGENDDMVDKMKRVIELPVVPKGTMFERKEEWEVFDKRVSDLERQYQLKDHTLWRGLLL
jgi:hypothetical protein